MKILDAGHRFELDNIDGTTRNIIQFVKREGSNYPGNKGTHAGTTSQEVIRALISRCKYVNKQIPCAETEMAIELLRTVILLFEQRAKRVRGKTLHLASAKPIELVSTCDICGHILCEEHVRG